MWNPWNVFLGDCPVVTAYLADKPLTSLPWVPVHVLNIFLRAIAQVVFVNNPLMGLIILAALFVFDPIVGLGCMLGGLTATVLELVVGLHPWDDLTNGVACFNAVLVGTVIPILYPAVYNTDRSLAMWLAVVGGSIVSVFFSRAFSNFLSKFSLPHLTLPFNLVTVFVFLALQPPQSQRLPTSETEADLNTTLSWPGVGRGILLSMSQVYAVNELEPSLMMNLAVLLGSPVLFVMASIGAALGTLLSLSFIEISEYDQVYDGIWGYNSLLSMAAVSCVFYPLTVSSFLAGLVNVVATVFIQKALAVNMSTNLLPVFTLPFTLSTMVMMMVTKESGRRLCGVGGQLERCEEMSYPDKQCWANIKRDEERGEEGTEEEKEPTITIVN